MYRPEVPRRNPFGLPIHNFKNEGQEGKINLFRGGTSRRWTQGKEE
jgi:hypothetical protein